MVHLNVKGAIYHKPDQLFIQIAEEKAFLLSSLFSRKLSTSMAYQRSHVQLDFPFSQTSLRVSFNLGVFLPLLQLASPFRNSVLIPPKKRPLGNEPIEILNSPSSRKPLHGHHKTQRK
jgi:hypothetical protein